MDEGGRSTRSVGRMEPSQAIIEAVADREGVEPTELAPPEYETLYEVVDPGALDALFAPRANGAGRLDGSVTFRFCGYTVSVTAEGTVSVEPAE
ncbi:MULTISPECIES: HalOD1 output domain-containing protein [Saliphagus]|uniref:HalOD1 output domain-containing protein n=1 Tax=Saliphagus infecundisoli TaxID=1849069 RepID=A0ABD5QCD4_9EURY|nr:MULTISPECIES: HalOD1 output domain-containing protein [Saliphagus]